MQNPSGWHNGQRVWGGGIIKYTGARLSEWLMWPIDQEREANGSSVDANNVPKVDKKEESRGKVTDKATGESMSHGAYIIDN